MIQHGDPLQVNFGGFVSLSTIDWRGRSACSVFLRGCPLRCSYCQNEAIQAGEDYRDLDEIVDMIRTSAPFISGVVISGGEPAVQGEALMALAESTKKMGLSVGIQTSGLFPEILETLIARGLADKIAIDYKTRWEGFSSTVKEKADAPGGYQKRVDRSIAICKRAWADELLPEFEVVVTVFYENEKYIRTISEKIGDAPLVLQQGEHKIPMMKDEIANMTAYIARKQNTIEQYTPMTLAEIQEIGKNLKRDVRIRTREVGEIVFNRRFIL
ncbi:MAG: anaerobic ribonucleoside-triphosphate reductase activating protein [Methanoregula sp.]|nr:anaerobic ribonucleoside-triphosphate reductase activating protein [Methanoregula sp.]